MWIQPKHQTHMVGGTAEGAEMQKERRLHGCHGNFTQKINMQTHLIMPPPDESTSGECGEDTDVGVPCPLSSPPMPAPSSRIGKRHMAMNGERGENAPPPTRRDGPTFA